MFSSAMQMTGSYSIDFDLLTEPTQKQQLQQQLQMHQQQQHQQQQLPQQLQLPHQPQLQLHQPQHHQQRFSEAVVVPSSYSLQFPSVEHHHVQSLQQHQPQQHLQQQQHLQLSQQQQQQQQQFQPAVPVAFPQYATRGVGHPGFVGHLDSLYAIAQPPTTAELQHHAPPHHLLVSQHPQHLMQQQQLSYQQPQPHQQQCSSIINQISVENDDVCDADSDSSRDDSTIGGAAAHGGAANRSATSRRPGSRVPDDLKSDAYWKRRVRNNLSAKKSREKKRIDERLLSQQFGQLSEEVYADLLVYCALQRCRDLLGGPDMRRRRALERPNYLEEVNRILYYEGICYGLREAFRNKGLPMRALLPWRQACEDLNTWTDRRFITFVSEQSAAGESVEMQQHLMSTQPAQEQQHQQTSAYFSVNSQMLSSEQQQQQQQQQQPPHSGVAERLKYSPASAAAY